MISKKFKKWATIGLVLYALNKSFVPVVSKYAFDSEHINDPEIQRYMNTREYIHDYDCYFNEENALKQLKLAHAVTMKYLTLGEPDYGSSTEEFLDKKIGDCTETSRFTYSNYLFLINKICRPELSDYVRLANGSIHGFGHAWLEIKQDGNWIPYETTRNELSEGYSINPDSIDRIVHSEEVLNAEKGYNRVAIHQVDKNGKTNHSIDVIGSIKEPGFLLLEWRNIFGY